MLKKIIKLLYIGLIFVILYFPLIQLAKYLKIKLIFTNKELITSILLWTFISALISCVIGIISLIISKYLFIKKKNVPKPLLFPLMVGVVIYILRTFIGINSYILIFLGYSLLLIPIISYLEFNYLKRFVSNNRAVLKDFNKIEFLRIMDKSIMTYYFVCFIIIYGDNIISSMLFDNNINILSSFITGEISKNDMMILSNCLYLSFGIILLLMLFVYMVVYELRLRGKYEKDN